MHNAFGVGESGTSSGIGSEYPEGVMSHSPGLARERLPRAAGASGLETGSSRSDGVTQRWCAVGSDMLVVELALANEKVPPVFHAVALRMRLDACARRFVPMFFEPAAEFVGTADVDDVASRVRQLVHTR